MGVNWRFNRRKVTKGFLKKKHEENYETQITKITMRHIKGRSFRYAKPLNID